MQTLADIRHPDHVVVEEAPSARPVMHGHLPMLKRETFYTMASGGLGFGLPAAVGIALALPIGARDRPGRGRLGGVFDPGPLERGAV